jgi:hypothetical protein
MAGSHPADPGSSPGLGTPFCLFCPQYVSTQRWLLAINDQIPIDQAVPRSTSHTSQTQTQTQTQTRVRAPLSFARPPFVSCSVFVSCVHLLARCGCWLSYLVQLLYVAYCLLLVGLQHGPVGCNCCTLLSSHPPILPSFYPLFGPFLFLTASASSRPRSRDPPSSFSVSTSTAFYTKMPLCPHAETCTFASRMSTHTRCHRLISDVRFMISEF